jgi:NADPH-dependent 2,4-dienoyl-CoA reductase/sulfur reductase-like enzyme
VTGVVPSRIVVVGASLAGLRAAETLREEGFGGTLVMVGDEARAPYDRPPLSKQLLTKGWAEDRVTLADPERLAELRIELRLGTAATGLDLSAREVALADGTTLGYDGLVVATGARARTLPGTEGVPGVHTLRTLDDALSLRAALSPGGVRVVVVGAGFIGAEVAAAATALGNSVTVVEMADVPFEPVLGARMGEVCAAILRENGVTLRTGAGVAALEGGEAVERVLLDDGSAVDADVVVVGIGVVPNTEWLEGSGLTLDDGVVCDETCRAAPGVVAAGDVARWPNPALGGEMMRVEHWDNAAHQGAHSARVLLAEEGRAAPFGTVPWFWSDQFGHTIQLAGRPAPDDEVRVIEGSVRERAFVAVYERRGRLVGALAIDRPRPVMRLRALIAEGASAAEAASGGRG